MFTHTPNSNELTQIRSISENGTSILLPTLVALLLALVPLEAWGQILNKCTYRVEGTLKAKHTQAYKDILGTNRSSLEGVQVRVQGKKLVLGGGVWGTWKTVRTDANGRFSVTKEKGCGKRRVRVRVKFKDADLEVRHRNATSSLTKVKWYTVYQTTSGKGSGLDKDKTLTFRSSGSRALGAREPRYHAEIWTLYQEAIAHMDGYGSRLAFQSRVKIKYPHDPVSPPDWISTKEIRSYANPLNDVIYLVKRDGGIDHGQKPEIALHELMHFWAYQHSRGEDGMASYLVANGTTHGIVKEPYVAFHEGFAEWAAQFVKEQIGPKTFEDPYSPSHLRNYRSGINRFDTVDRADHGWYNIFSLMHAPQPWEFNFETNSKTLSRTNTAASDIVPFKNCGVGQLSFRELMNTIDRKGQQDITTGHLSSTGDMNWSSFSGRVVSQSNGVNRSDIQAYKTMLDPTLSRQEILRSMCTEGGLHTVVVTSEDISGKTTYTVKASRTLKQVEDTLEGMNVTEDASDQVSGATATGRVRAGADGFKVADDIDEITLDTPDAATVYVDDKEYHTIVISGGNTSGKTTYTVKASDDLTQVSGSLDGRSGITIDPPDQVNGATASGQVSSGTDGFKVVGTIQEIRLDNPDAATVYVDDGGPLGGGAPLEVYATRRVSQDRTADFGKTGADVRFRGTSGSATVSVRKLGSGPNGTRGIPESNVSDYRFVMDAVGNLTFETSTEVRLDVGTLAGSGNAANVTVYKRPTEGSGQFSPLTTSFDQGQNELVATTGSFSEFVFASDSEPLPVEMASFDAMLHDDRVRLHWQTASETNNSGFKVQRRSGRGDSWKTLEFIDTKADGGTTTESRTYRFDDFHLPYEATSLRYRLKQVDLDGTTQLTDAITIRRSVQSVSLPAPFPNPARSQATIRFEVRESQDVTLSLYNTLGEKVRTLVNGSRKGRQETKVDVSSLSSGTYFLRLRAGGQARTRRLTIVR